MILLISSKKKVSISIFINIFFSLFDLYLKIIFVLRFETPFFLVASPTELTVKGAVFLPASSAGVKFSKLARSITAKSPHGFSIEEI